MDSMWRAWHSMVIKYMSKWLKPDLYSSSGLRTRLAFVHASLGTRPSKNRKGLVIQLGWKCTLRPVWRRTNSDWLLISILMCVYWKCEPHENAGEDRLVQQKTLQALQGSAINKIPNILQCTLPPRPVYQTLLSDFSRVWLQDYH